METAVGPIAILWLALDFRPTKDLDELYKWNRTLHRVYHPKGGIV